ncbi:hypothetical protein KDI_42780 [Dictyobacter arantiisoli]|uniref:Uncharacterized protein n=1 Tax=Dictyobacter arantiisoli TaxID=2014874 RepID=A0A5A5TIC5_9CHLR|nr:hypothetical protein KDI_42780 [Dictyobacter arantiisoli]
MVNDGDVHFAVKQTYMHSLTYTSNFFKAPAQPQRSNTCECAQAANMVLSERWLTLPERGSIISSSLTDKTILIKK